MTTIEVWADVTCPFTHVGLRRMAERRAELRRADVVLQVRAWPLELVNGERPARELIVEEVAALRASVAPDLFLGFDPDHFPMSSLAALALSARAYRSDPGRGEAVSFALREALFEEGRDLGARGELAAIAERCDVGMSEPRDAATVLDDWARGRARGVIGSPHFFAGRDGYFCPSLTIERVHGKLEVEVDSFGLATFVDRCFVTTPPGGGATTRS